MYMHVVLQLLPVVHRLHGRHDEAAGEVVDHVLVHHDVGVVEVLPRTEAGMV